MNRLRVPDVTAEHMPVVPTARMRELRAEINTLKAQTQRQIEILEAEYDRLTVIEQHKVLAEMKRRIIANEKKRIARETRTADVLSDAEILAMAEEIRNTQPFAEKALVAAYADSH